MNDSEAAKHYPSDCPYCQHLNPGDAQYCSRCGKLMVRRRRGTTKTTQEQSHGKKGKKFASIMLGTFIGLGIVIQLLFGMEDETSPHQEDLARLEVPFASSSSGPLNDPNAEWYRFIRDCGSDAQDKHSVRAEHLFETVYENMQLSGMGTITNIREQVFGSYYELWLDMGTPRDPLTLEVPTSLKGLILGLEEGDRVLFRGTLRSQGAGFLSDPLVRAESIEKIGT